MPHGVYTICKSACGLSNQIYGHLTEWATCVGFILLLFLLLLLLWLLLTVVVVLPLVIGMALIKECGLEGVCDYESMHKVMIFLINNFINTQKQTNTTNINNINRLI